MSVPFFRSGFHAIAKVRRFAHDERGGFAIMAALALVPLVIAIGVAIDIAEAVALRTKVQQGLDSAILQACKNAAVTASDGELKKKAENQFNANVNDPRATLSNFKIDPGRLGVSADATVAYSTLFGSFLNKSTLDIGATTSCRVDATLEIALVIDTTGSMAESAGGKSKMEAAKDAAKEFVNALMSVPSSKTRISIVPFAAAVNVGKENRNASWMDTSAASPAHWDNLTKTAGITRFKLFDQLGEAWGGCVETRPGTHATSDDKPGLEAPSSLYVPLFAPDEPGDKGANFYSYYGVNNSYIDDGGGTCKSPPSSDWMERQNGVCKYAISGNSWKKSILSNGGTNDGALRGPNYMCSSKRLLHMTADKNTLLDKISSLQPVGNTNILEGLMWGWRTISPNGPFAEGKPYSIPASEPPNRKIIILMTDGDNTWTAASNPDKSLYSAMGYFINNRIATGITNDGQANTQMNNKTLEACRNIKAPKARDDREAITIYSVGFSVAGREISPAGLTLLKSCASTGLDGNPLYYKATSATDIVSIFKQIAIDVGNLRLTN